MRNFILATFSALFLSFVAAQNQPPAGTYYIVNNVSSPAGDKLAATYQAGQSNIIVTPLNQSDVQRWTITLGEQFIIPVNAQSQAATAQGSNVVILPKNSFVWTIKNITDVLYTIADQSQFWDLGKAGANENIVLTARTASSPTQSWQLQPVN